jgi:hypothetical protein
VVFSEKDKFASGIPVQYKYRQSLITGKTEMRVSDTLKNCVCFLCGKNNDGTYHYGGTGFFVAIPSQTQPDKFSHVYLVTAKHTIIKAQDEGYHRLHLRIATAGGGADFLETSGDWTFPDDPVTDIAVLPLAIPANFTAAVVTLDLIATDAVISSMEVGIGDELIIMGLFPKRTGIKRNIPIVRSGIIAAMPEEPIEDELSGETYEAYLAEVRSIGGLSGSPVFLRKEIVGSYTKNLGMPLTTTKIVLLGLIRGHWGLRESKSLIDFAPEERDLFNSGIAIVTPIKDALTIINGEKLVRERRTIDEQHG